MWPFDRGVILALYLGTLALHAAFIGYVVGGTGYALVQALRGRDDAIADTVRDRLPFMLGSGITAGIAPLLFVQLLHQRRFYTANLLLGPRWMAVVPALILGFYALYLAKKSSPAPGQSKDASGRWRRPALACALACFVFVAWSWSELHELMAAEPAWRGFYAAGDRWFVAGTIAPRLVVVFGAMVTLFATIAAWSADQRGGLARLALAGRVASIAGAAWLWRAGFTVDGAARAWFGVLVAAVVVEAIAWLWVARSPRALAVVTAAGSGALLAAVVVREAPRVALIEPEHVLAAGAGGWLVFALALVLGAAAIAWIVRLARAAS